MQSTEMMGNEICTIRWAFGCRELLEMYEYVKIALSFLIIDMNRDSN